MSIPEYIELEGGYRMPRIGFGTWQVSLYTFFISIYEIIIEYMVKFYFNSSKYIVTLSNVSLVFIFFVYNLLIIYNL